MSTQLATQKPRITLASLVKTEAIQSRFREVLRDRAPEFMSSMVQVGHSLGDDCDPMSIISGAMIAATLNLPINKNLGFAWLVPFKEKGVKYAQFQIGAKGYTQLALRTGHYRRMNARPVNKECVGGYDSVGEPVIDWTKLDESKPAFAYVFAWELVNGFIKVCCWTKEEVEIHAQRYSQSYKGGYNSPWKTHFDEMALKTVIANELRRWGIMSVEMVKAASSDQGVIKEIEGEISFPDAVRIGEPTPPDQGAAAGAPTGTEAPKETKTAEPAKTDAATTAPATGAGAGVAAAAAGAAAVGSGAGVDAAASFGAVAVAASAGAAADSAMAPEFTVPATTDEGKKVVLNCRVAGINEKEFIAFVNNTLKVQCADIKGLEEVAPKKVRLLASEGTWPDFQAAIIEARGQEGQ